MIGTTSRIHVVEESRHMTYARQEMRRIGVEVGRDVAPAELAGRYDAVLYATGAAGDKALGVPGEQLAGSVSAREVVNWYTGHPGAAPVDLSRVQRVVVGAGNVALDVARMLAADPGRLAGTATSAAALAALGTSALREVVVVGRRGAGGGGLHPVGAARADLPGRHPHRAHRHGPRRRGAR